ncbi:phosphonate metabolism transcriptional regulator PhnF [Desulfocurvus sp. DL9XJH121]
MQLERGTGVALWRQIQKALERDIASGRFAAGEKLPTETELSAVFDVNRHTVRRAMQALEAKGLVSVEQGRGSFVAEEMVSYDLSRRVSFSRNLLKQHRTPAGEVLTAEVVSAEGRVAEMLRLLPGAPVLRMETTSKADGKGLNISTGHYPQERFPGIAAVYRETGSVTKGLARHGVDDYVRRETRITTHMPSARDARILGQPRNKPVILVESVNVDLQGVPVEYAVTRWAGDRVEFVIKT